MFFRKKKREQEIEETTTTADAGDSSTVEGTAPDVVEAESTATLSDGSDTSIKYAEGEARTPILKGSDDVIRLFPGFERDDFEVGYRPDGERPALMLRWKDGGDWFSIPPLFNRGILSAMDERDSQGDLNRLLRNYGYDVETDK